MKKGEVWFVEIPAIDGHEQSGVRPVIVLSESEANIVVIVPFTSNLQALRFTNTIEVNPSLKNGLKSKSVALVFQLRAIDKRRLKNKIGTIEDITLDKIDNVVKKMLNLE